MGKFNNLKKPISLIKDYKNEHIEIYFRIRSPFFGSSLSFESSVNIPTIDGEFVDITNYITKFTDEISVTSVPFYSKEGTLLHTTIDSKNIKLTFNGNNVLLDIFNWMGKLFGGSSMVDVNGSFKELDILKVDKKSKLKLEKDKDGKDIYVNSFIIKNTLYRNVFVGAFGTGVSAEGYEGVVINCTAENYYPNWSGKIWKSVEKYDDLLDGKFN